VSYEVILSLGESQCLEFKLFAKKLFTIIELWLTLSRFKLDNGMEVLLLVFVLCLKFDNGEEVSYYMIRADLNRSSTIRLSETLQSMGNV